MTRDSSSFEKMRQERRDLLASLARQSEARKRKVKELLEQCAEQRDKREKPPSAPHPPPAEPTLVPIVDPIISIPPVAIPVSQPSVGTDASLVERLGKVEAALAALRQEAIGSIDGGAIQRCDALDARMGSVKEALEEIVGRLRSLNGDLSGVKDHLTKLESGLDSFQSRTSGWEAATSSVDEDCRRSAEVIESFAGKLRQLQDRLETGEQSRAALDKNVAGELTNLAHRFSKVESGLLWAIDMVQSSEHGAGRLANLRERVREIEAGLQQILQTLDSIQRPSDSEESTAGRQSTASVLASLSKLVSGLRGAQSERPLATTSGRTALPGVHSHD
jgi:DNA repair exonuclease SbcCD ATPase subunit